jgi:hypothetical protein
MKYCVKRLRGGLVILAITSAFGFGCATSQHRPDPLAGFHASSLVNLDSNKAITDDYNNYIQTLSSEEKKYLGPSPVSFFEDGTGQHAVRIKLGLNGTVWEHVLIYNKDNRRIKTVKYQSGHYAS